MKNFKLAPVLDICIGNKEYNGDELLSSGWVRINNSERRGAFRYAEFLSIWINKSVKISRSGEDWEVDNER